MMELLGLVLGGVAGLFLFKKISTILNTKNQDQLMIEVKKIDEEIHRIQNDISKKKEKTLEQVDGITKEQNKNISGNDLADWFNKRK